MFEKNLNESFLRPPFKKLIDYTHSDYEEIFDIFHRAGLIHSLNVMQTYKNMNASEIEHLIMCFFKEQIKQVLYCSYEDIPLVMGDLSNDEICLKILYWRLRNGK